MISWSSKLKPVPTSLSCFFIIITIVIVVFIVIIWGFSCFFFATLHTKLILLWGEAMTELYAAVRCSRDQLPAASVAGAAARNNHYWFKALFSLIYTFIVNKVLPHFISEVEKCIICLLFCPPPPILNCEICDLFKRWVNHSLVCMSS